MFTRHPRACVALFLTTVGGTVAFYFALVYLPVYAEHVGAAGKADASAFMTVVFVVVLATMLAAGALTDRVGVLPMLRWAYLALLLGMVPLVVALEHGVLGFRTVAVALGVLVAVPLATTNVMSGLLFPTAIRAVGAGVVGATSIALFGGTFPLIAEALTGSGHTSAIPYYVAAAMGLALVGVVVAAKLPGLATTGGRT